MERVITVKVGTDLANHIADIVQRFGSDARLHYELIPYHIVKMWRSPREGHVDVKLKQIT